VTFTGVAASAVVITLAVLVIAFLQPAYLVPTGIGLGMVGAVPFLVRYVRARAVAATKQRRGLRSYAVEPLSRIKATVEAFHLEAKPDIPELLDYMLQQAVLQQASDIHLVPYRDFTLVRYRIDGILTDIARLAPGVRELVTSRLKVLAEAVIYVHDRPQDGRLDLKVGDRDVDLRVAFMPTLHGERVVMRVLARGELGFDLQSLGFTPEQLAVFSDIIFRPQGMVIMNGPAGSGKTTTIYAALRAVLEHSKHSTSTYTLEDPIEYDLMNINQTQIEETQGFTFAHGLRTMLRQDPDVIMVGEIRDLDTARIAVQAGMTGHLIITTVHAKQAAGVFVRLAEVGVDPHSLASAVTAVVAQWVVGVVCRMCRRLAPATPGEAAKLGLAVDGQQFSVPVGCPACNQKGYTGRVGIYEILQVDENMRELITERASPDRIYRHAVERGMTTLIENGVRLARSGETSLEEVLRVLPPEQRGA
jgi:type II secretory ATPase GspE/PulE/Tfp pilus assembly ATPase PilB-like protein